MHSRAIKIAVFVLILTSLIKAQEPIEVESLINDILSEDQQSALLGYTYHLEFIRSKKTFYGKDRLTKRFEAILPARFAVKRTYKHPLLLVYDSNRLITAQEIIQRRNEIVEKLEQMENAPDLNENAQSGSETKGYVILSADENTVGKQRLSIDVAELLKKSVYRNPKNLLINGRNVISVEFKPAANIKPENTLFYLSLIEGTILIDKNDRRIIEIEGFPVGRSDQYKTLPPLEREKFRVFYYKQIKVDRSHWFPQEAKLNFMEFPKEFNDLDVKIEFTFSNYKRFKVDVESVDLESKEGPQQKE